MEKVQQLLPEDLQRAAGARHHGVIQETAAPELFAPDDREQRLPVLGIRLIEQRLQAGANVQKRVDRDPDGGDADGQEGERAGAGDHARHGRP